MMMADDTTPRSCASRKKALTHLMTRSKGSSSPLPRTTKTSFGKSRSGVFNNIWKKWCYICGTICLEAHLEGTNLSDHTVLKLKEIVNLQASLWEAVQRLPEGSERLDALREIDHFQTRMAVFIRRLGSEALA
jgi:hypothetical protein